MDILSQVVDICSSGQGCDLGNWHKKELKKLFKTIPSQNEKENFFIDEFIPNVFASDGWQVSDIQLVKELLDITKPIKITI